VGRRIVDLRVGLAVQPDLARQSSGRGRNSSSCFAFIAAPRAHLKAAITGTLMSTRGRRLDERARRKQDAQ